MIFVNGTDISGAVLSVDFCETLNSGSSTLKFVIPTALSNDLRNGAEVRFSYKGENVFCGWIFSCERSADNAVFACRDSLRYLELRIPILRGNETIGGFLKRLIAAVGGRAACGEIEDIAFLTQAKRFDNESVIEVILRSLDEVRRMTGERLFIKDENKSICLRCEKKADGNLVLKTEGLITEYTHRVSIGDEAANYVEVISNNAKEGVTQCAIAKNDSMIAKWGMLCLYRKENGKNAAQLLNIAKSQLNERCRETEKLDVTAVGNIAVRTGVRLFIQLFAGEAFEARVISVRHSFCFGEHNMRVSLERV